MLDRYGLLTPPTRNWLTDVGADHLPPHTQCALAMVRRDELVDDQA
jgi:hypothetical protein